ncbi:MAG: hypothetical protein JWM78_1510 [Verrucomicrobiaceae bacterium]|nr:hypothetical protein [Verrucomicrobiaceae bacterium]
MFKAALIFFSFIVFAFAGHAAPLSARELADLAPSGKLRIGINTGNMLLTGTDPVTGKPRGIAFDLAAELTRRVGIPVEIVTFDSAGKLAAGVKTNAWDVAFLGIEPERAEGIHFTAPYAEIESTYLVPAGSPLREVADVDRKGVRIAISDKSAYDLYLSRNLHNANLVRVPGEPGVPGIEGAFNAYVAQKLDALAGLKPVLIAYADKQPGSRVLAGHISIVKQAIGTPNGRDAGAKYLREFVEDIKASGLVAKTLDKNGARGVLVAPPQAVR